jgi:hypothetical protein
MITLTQKLPELIPAEAVAAYFGISKNGLWRMRKSGRINALKINGKVFFKLEEIENFINQSTEKKLVNA